MTSATQMRRIGDLVDILGGGTPSKKEPSYWSGPVPWVSPKDMKRWEIHDAIDHVSHAAVTETACKLVSPPAVLLVVRGMILAHSVPVAISRVPLAINQDLKALVPKDGVDPEYLAFMLAGATPELLARVEIAGHGTRRLPTEAWTSFELRVPPLPEQNRIVARIKTCTDRISELCKLRAESRAIATALLPAYLNEAAGTLGAPLVPLGNVLLGTQNGRSIRTNGETGDGAVLTLSAVRRLTLDLSASKVVSFDESIAEKYRINRGDVFISRSNTRNLVGLSAIVTDEPPPRTIYPDLLIRLTPDTEQLRSPFLAYALRFPDVRRQIQDRASGTSQSMVKISGERLREVCIPVPPLSTQERVVEELDEAYGTCTSLQGALAQPEVDYLRSAVLRKAFAGEL